MKDNTKIILYSCFTMILAMFFALTISFKAINSSKAAVLGPSDSNLTYNEGQSLIAIGADEDIPTSYGISLQVYSYNDNYSFLLMPIGNYSFPNSYIRYFNCTYSYLDSEFTCTSYSAYTFTGGGGSLSSSSSTIRLFKSDFTNEYLLSISFVPSSLGGVTLHNVVFSTRGISYSDGYYDGNARARLNVFNELYYQACMTSISGSFVCPTNYYSSGDIATIPSIEQVLSDITSFRGLNNSAVPIELFNYISYANSDYFQQCQLISNECVVWQQKNYTFSGLKAGIEILIGNIELLNEDGSYRLGYEDGYTEGNSIGYNQGYGVGYDLGLIEGTGREDILGNAVISIASTPLTILSGMLNFNILGFNVFSLVLSLFTLMLVIWVIKKVLF